VDKRKIIQDGAINLTAIYHMDSDTPELMEQSNLSPRAALTAYRDDHGYSGNIIHIGYSSYACVTAKGLFYARRAK
jgi:hypothetical protein